MLEFTIVDNADLKITATLGSTDIAVVCFSGVAYELGQVPREEFVKTFSDATHSQYFVVDKNRSWYNATHEEILSCLAPHLGKYRRVVTLGNSMGGFGAIYFAPRFANCQRAIALAPQFSIDPAIVPEETRWQEYRAHIKQIALHHAMEGARKNLPLDIFFGVTVPQDVMQERCFRRHATSRMAIYTAEKSGHGLAADLRHEGLLRSLMNAIVAEDASPAHIVQLLAQSTMGFQLWQPMERAPDL